MLSISSTDKELWQKEYLSTFFEMVEARDGDFTVLAKLSRLSQDDESTGKILKRISSHSQGKRAISSRLRLGDIDFNALLKLPQESLGFSYAKHMLDNQLKPLQPTDIADDASYLGAHIAETHDIWHVVIGANTDIVGEIKLEAFYVAQLQATRLFQSLLAKNILKSAVYNIDSSARYMDAITQGWLLGKEAKPLFGVEWTQQWHKPLEQVRESLNIKLL